MKRRLCAAAIFLLAGTPAVAHRLDEYLQGTILSIEKNRMNAQITLTPGVAVFPILVPDIDTDGNGVISGNERHAYAGSILRDLSLRIDGLPLTLQLLSFQFPAMEEMKEGRGEIRIEFTARLPEGGPHRKLILENRHESRISFYQVNSLVPRDPDIRILGQNRNYSQSYYELDFLQAGAPPNALSFTWLTGTQAPLGIVGLLLSVRLAWLWAQRRRRLKGIDSRECPGTEAGV